jgi:uncharacterized protein (DUF58 family)
LEVKEIIKKVKLIELKTKRTNEVFMGEYHSSYKGRGMTFSEVRPYNYGDEIRSIDWNKTAHFNEPYIKVFEEERELILMLLVDMSASLDYGTRKQTKKQTLVELCATLAFSSVNNNDKVGAILYTDQIELYIPPKKGKKQVLKILRELIQRNPVSKKTNLEQALNFFNTISKRKSIVFILSDFENTNFETALKTSAKKHNLTGIRIYDEKEQMMPSVGLVKMKDLETNEIKLIDTNSKITQEKHKLYYQHIEQYFSTAFSKNGLGAISIKNNQDYIKPLLNFFKKQHN